MCTLDQRDCHNANFVGTDDDKLRWRQTWHHDNQGGTGDYYDASGDKVVMLTTSAQSGMPRHSSFRWSQWWKFCHNDDIPVSEWWLTGLCIECDVDGCQHTAVRVETGKTQMQQHEDQGLELDHEGERHQHLHGYQPGWNRQDKIRYTFFVSVLQMNKTTLSVQKHKQFSDGNHLQTGLFWTKKSVVVLSPFHNTHYNDVIMIAMASQITGFSIVCLTACSGADQRKHQSSASLAFVRGIHRWPVDSPHERPVTMKMFPFDDVIMLRWYRLFKPSSEKTGHRLSHCCCWPCDVTGHGISSHGIDPMLQEYLICPCLVHSHPVSNLWTTFLKSLTSLKAIQIHIC